MLVFIPILKNSYWFLILLVFLGAGREGFAQKEIGDMTLHYELATDSNHLFDSNRIRSFSKTLYIRGGMCRSTINTSEFSQSIIYDRNGDKAYVLYNLNDQNYVSILNKTQWQDQYKRYKGMRVRLLKNDNKKILGYNCNKAVAHLTNGSEIIMYYTQDIKTTVGDNPYEVSAIPGLILEYEIQILNDDKITITASKIDFNPVPAALFIVPEKGYRILDPSKIKNDPHSHS